MQKLFTALFVLCVSTASAQQKGDTTSTVTKTAKPMIVEAACGQCRLGLPGNGCDLAVRVEGKAYFVDGTGIDEHGDAHADDGFCKAVRKATVQGKIVNGRFKATSFALVKEAPIKQ